MTGHRHVGALLVIAALGAAALAIAAWGVDVVAARALPLATHASRPTDDRFQHAKHARLFPLCSTCHAGVTEAGQPVWPNPSGCASCHDGVIQQRVNWQPRTASLPTRNLRFTHEAHARAATAKNPADSALSRNCSACHNERGAPRMAVTRAVVNECVTCHGLTAPHVDVPSEACATCHVPVTAARNLTRADIEKFPKPRSHEAADFVIAGHGKAAKGSSTSGPLAVAASCATCHAQNFCITCHVNAPESPVIRALAMDDRSPSTRRRCRCRESWGRQVCPHAWQGCATRRRDLRDLPRPGELRELPHWGAVRRRDRNASRWSGPRSGRAARASGTGEPLARVQGTARIGRERTPLIVRDLPRTFDVSRLSSSRRHATSRLPPCAVSHAAPKLCVRSRGELQRLPQPGAVLPELPPAVRSRRHIATRPGRLSRRLSQLQPRPRPGGTPEPRVVRRLSC